MPRLICRNIRQRNAAFLGQVIYSAVSTPAFVSQFANPPVGLERIGKPWLRPAFGKATAYQRRMNRGKFHDLRASGEVLDCTGSVS